MADATKSVRAAVLEVVRKSYDQEIVAAGGDSLLVFLEQEALANVEDSDSWQDAFSKAIRAIGAVKRDVVHVLDGLSTIANPRPDAS